jgi:hypothetical protein
VVIDDTWASGRTAWVGMITILGKSYIKISGLKLINQAPTVYCNHAPYDCIDGSANKGFSPDNGILVQGIYVETRDANNQRIATVSTPADNIIIENNYIEETHSSGIGVWNSTNVIINGNTIVNGQNDHWNGQTGSDQEVLDIVETTGFEVTNNFVTYNGRLDNHGVPFWGTPGALAITAKGGGHINQSTRNGKIHNNRITNNKINGSIYLDAEKTPLDNMDVYQNYVYDAADGYTVGSECGGTVSNVRIFNNVAHYMGVGVLIAAVSSCYDPDPYFHGDGPKINISIYNNTIFGGWQDGGQGIWITSSNIQNITVKNNIVALVPVAQNDINNCPHHYTDGTLYYGCYMGQISQLSTDPRSGIPIPSNQIFSSNNLVVDKTIYPMISASTVVDLPGSIIANPQFVRSTIGIMTKADLPLAYTENYSDLHLISTSPAIDAGYNLASTFTNDFDGIIRPQGSGYDIGAYEYVSGGTPTPTLTPTPTPTPKLGDANGDGLVNETDFTIWLSRFGQAVSGVANGDFNGDGRVDGIDYTIWLNNYGK